MCSRGYHRGTTRPSPARDPQGALSAASAGSQTSIAAPGSVWSGSRSGGSPRPSRLAAAAAPDRISLETTLIAAFRPKRRRCNRRAASSPEAWVHREQALSAARRSRRDPQRGSRLRPERHGCCSWAARSVTDRRSAAFRPKRQRSAYSRGAAALMKRRFGGAIPHSGCFASRGAPVNTTTTPFENLTAAR